MHSRRPNLLLTPGSGMRLSVNCTPGAAVNELIAEGDWDALRPMMSGPHLRSCLWRVRVVVPRLPRLHLMVAGASLASISVA